MVEVLGQEMQQTLSVGQDQGGGKGGGCFVPV
jgi:hypothetical protein